jgi:hypothetical protein
VTDRISSTRSSPSTTFVLEADVVESDMANNRSRVRCYLRCNNAGNSSSYYGGSGYQAGSIDGVGEFGRHSGNPFLPSGYGSGAQRWRDGPFDVWIGHDANGYHGDIVLRMALVYGSINDSSMVAGLALPRIARPPAAPSSLSVRAGSVTPTNFGVDYTRGDNMGAGIDQDHAEWSRVSDGVVVWNDYGPSGYTSPNGGATPGAPALTPGTDYRVRVRSHNAAGWGSFSGYVTQRTLSSVYVGKGGTYVAGQIYVGKGGSYVPAQILVGKGGSYVQAG